MLDHLPLENEVFISALVEPIDVNVGINDNPPHSI
jgi:hypothetical protein